MILSPVEGNYRLTQKFGQRPEVYGQFGLEGHNGIDVTGPIKGKSVPVYSPYDGIAWIVRNDRGGYGRHVKILTEKDGKGLLREVVIAHLSSVTIKQGDRVYLGDKIGMMGNTGFSSAMHLHIGLRRRNEDLSVVDYDNGYKGYVDFEPYMLPWSKDIKIQYPYG